MKIGFDEQSVLSPLLFSGVLNIVSSEARGGLPSELLYAGDLVVMASTMEQLGRRIAVWRIILLDNRLMVHVGK